MGGCRTLPKCRPFTWAWGREWERRLWCHFWVAGRSWFSLVTGLFNQPYKTFRLWCLSLLTRLFCCCCGFLGVFFILFWGCFVCLLWGFCLFLFFPFKLCCCWDFSSLFISTSLGRCWTYCFCAQNKLFVCLRWTLCRCPAETQLCRG